MHWVQAIEISNYVIYQMSVQLKVYDYKGSTSQLESPMQRKEWTLTL